MLKIEHLRKDLEPILLEPIQANPLNDVIIYLDLFHKKSKLQYLDNGVDGRNGDVIQVIKSR